VLISVTAVLVTSAAPTTATPIIDSVFSFSDRWGPNSLPSAPEGDYVQLGAFIAGASTSDPLASLQVQATQRASTVPLIYNPSTAPIYADPLYAALIPFAGAMAAIGWTITATDSTGTSAPAFTIPFNPVLLPFASNVAVSDLTPTPTVSWALPDLSGFAVDGIELRVIDARTESQRFLASLPPDSTSFSVPAGILSPGESYVHRVILNAPSARSNAFSQATSVPEPERLALVLAALGGAVLARRLR
jgi:hypothetical protein